MECQWHQCTALGWLRNSSKEEEKSSPGCLSKGSSQAVPKTSQSSLSLHRSTQPIGLSQSSLSLGMLRRTPWPCYPICTRHSVLYVVRYVVQLLYVVRILSICCSYAVHMLSVCWPYVVHTVAGSLLILLHFVLTEYFRHFSFSNSPKWSVASPPIAWSTPAGFARSCVTMCFRSKLNN